MWFQKTVALDISNTDRTKTEYFVLSNGLCAYTKLASCLNIDFGSPDIFIAILKYGTITSNLVFDHLKSKFQELKIITSIQNL